MVIISAIIYGCVPVSLLFCFAILVLRLRGHKAARLDLDMIRTPGWKTKFPHIALWAINIYSKILTPFVFIVFLVWVEWIISYDLQSESTQLVGQWAPLVDVGLVLIAAVVGRYWPEGAKLWRRLRSQRAAVRSGLTDESVWESLKYVWNDHDLRGSWSQVGSVYLQDFGD
jgi:hypothetical protein